MEGSVYGIKIEGAAGTVGNFGMIAATGQGEFGARDGIWLRDGGIVTNGASTDTTALIDGHQETGIDIGGAAGTVVNYGTITAASHNYPTQGTGIYLSGGLVSNAASGSISAGIGISAGGDATVINAGTISAFEPIELEFGSVTNTTSGTLATADSIAISISDTGTVINEGRIAGYFRVVTLNAGTITNTSSGTITSIRSAIEIGNSGGTSSVASLITPARS